MNPELVVLNLPLRAANVITVAVPSFGAQVLRAPVSKVPLSVLDGVPPQHRLGLLLTVAAAALMSATVSERKHAPGR